MFRRFIVFFLTLATSAVLTGAGPAPIDSLLGKCPSGQTYWDNHHECRHDGVITEIDGVSVDELSKVLDAHRDELHAIKGVMGSSIDQHGITVKVRQRLAQIGDQRRFAGTGISPEREVR